MFDANLYLFNKFILNEFKKMTVLRAQTRSASGRQLNTATGGAPSVLFVLSIFTQCPAGTTEPVFCSYISLKVFQSLRNVSVIRGKVCTDTGVVG